VSSDIRPTIHEEGGTTITSASNANDERADLLETLPKHRRLLRHTVRGLTDEQARLRPTASELTLGGHITHVTAAERTWAAFIVDGPPAFRAPKSEMLPGETLEGQLSAHAAVARQTAELVRMLPDLDE
jgi:hypothetical protein